MNSSAGPSIDSPRSGSYTHPTGTTTLTSIAEQSEEHNVGVSTPNIVIYGETGAGKSSIIHLIAGQELAHTSNDASSFRYTFQHQRHIVDLNGMSCAIWETRGLDEGTEGQPATALAESNLKLLIHDLDDTGGIHLVVYCVRADRATRITLKALQRNYDLFYVSVCRKKVPVALVVTGLERQQGEMEAWWPANEAVLRRHGMRFNAHACVTTLDNDHVIRQRRDHSQSLLRELVVRYSRLPAWAIGPSYISSVFPMFQTALRRTMNAGRTKKAIITRRATTSDMVSAGNVSAPIPMLSPDILFCGTHPECVQIEGRPYEPDYVDERASEMHTLQVQPVESMGGGSGEDVFVLCTSPVGNRALLPEGSRHARGILYRRGRTDMGLGLWRHGPPEYPLSC